MASEMKSAVKEAYEEKAIESGHLIGKRLWLILEQLNSFTSKLVDEKFEVLLQKLEETGQGVVDKTNTRYNIGNDADLYLLNSRIDNKVGRKNVGILQKRKSITHAIIMVSFIKFLKFLNSLRI